MADTAQPPRGDATRDSLIATAIEVFSRQGFHAASTRAIAEAAGVNQALIGYHFRSKDGLYVAAFEHIADRIRERIGPTASAIEAVLAAPDDAADPQARRQRYLPPLLQLTDAFIELMAKDESATWARLIIREQQAPTQAFAVLYDSVMGPLTRLLTTLVARLDPDRAVGDPQLTVATIIGQALVFRTARAAVMRLMDWSEIAEEEVASIQAQVRRNLSTLFSGTEPNR